MNDDEKKKVAGIREQPGCEVPKLPDLTSEKVDETMSDYDYQELVHITDTIAMKVKAFNQKPTKEQDSPTRPTQAEVLKVLSPGSETTYQTYTPKRKRAFERGLLAGMKSRRSENPTQSTGPSLKEDIATPSVEGSRKEGARARKSLFAPPVDNTLDSRQGQCNHINTFWK
ncbi:uncharacterized protein [Montipora foliosa]|uniref:uncharacterized protein n=1 Tax=Montipora foliosa TaxID=591990 RepID=UPI0035F1618C